MNRKRVPTRRERPLERETRRRVRARAGEMLARDATVDLRLRVAGREAQSELWVTCEPFETSDETSRRNDDD